MLFHGLQELVPVVAVIYYRSIPILVIPEYYMWPVNSIFQFPTYIPGHIPGHTPHTILSNIPTLCLSLSLSLSLCV